MRITRLSLSDSAFPATSLAFPAPVFNYPRTAFHFRPTHRCTSRFIRFNNVEGTSVRIGISWLLTPWLQLGFSWAQLLSLSGM